MYVNEDCEFCVLYRTSDCDKSACGVEETEAKADVSGEWECSNERN